MSNVLAQIEEQRERSHQMVRDMLKNDPQALAQYDAGMEEIRSGRSSLRSLWHTLSPAQRKLVRTLNNGLRHLYKTRGQASFYDAYGEPHAITKAARAATVRVLVAHKVMLFEEYRGDPEFKAVLAARGYALVELLRGEN